MSAGLMSSGLVAAGMLSATIMLAVQETSGAEPTGGARLIARWPLAADAQDVAGQLHGSPHNVSFGSGPGGSVPQAAVFNGRDSMIDIADAEPLHFGQEDFSLAVWVKCETPLSNALGDLVSKFDPVARRGVNWHIAGSSPAYNGMSDTRHVHYGIDDGFLGEPEDCGKPWPSNSLITCLIVFDGALYCGIADADRSEDKARVFRYDGDQRWIDCGRLGGDPNHHSVQSMIVHEGELYAGTGIYDWVQARGREKGLPAAAPTRVFVYEGGTIWRDLGQVGSGSRVVCLGSFDGELYAGVDSVGAGHAYRYDGTQWIDCGSPDGENLECFFPMAGKLYASTHGSMYEYQGGQSWKTIGSRPQRINQIHSMQVYEGRLLAGTWPQGYVLKYAGGLDWDIMGRLGLPEGVGDNLCNEINALTVYNGKLYAGAIPKAEFYRYERDGDWTLLAQVASRADWEQASFPTWLRLTALTAYQGKLFGCTGSCQGRAVDAPADSSLGRVFAIQAGQVVSHERDIGGDWTHLAAVRSGRELRLYLNGQLSATSTLRPGPAFDLTNAAPLRIGFGAQNYFSGAMAELRLYAGALQSDEIRTLAAK
ncbi:MAG: LamG domain-containing protein [Planctomycetaceae bacterium]